MIVAAPAGEQVRIGLLFAQPLPIRSLSGARILDRH